MENFKGNEKALQAATGLVNVSTTGIVLKNLDLIRATERIASAGLQIQQSAIVIGTELLNVKRNKWYKDDFKSFEDYCTTCFGIGKSHRARFMQIADKLVTENGEYPENIALLSDTVKAEIAVRVSNYQEASDLVSELEIIPDMSVAKVKEILKKHFNPTPEISTEGDSETKPVDDSKTKPVDDSKTKPVDDSKTKPVDDSETKPVDDSETKPVDDSETKPVDDSKADTTAEAVSLSMAVAEDIIKAVKMAQSPDSVSRVYINIANALFRMLKISNDNWEKATPRDKDFDPYTLAIVKDSNSIETVFGPIGEIFNEYGDKVLMYIEQ